MKIYFSTFFCCLLFWNTSPGAEPTLIPWANGRITIDGKLEEAAWRQSNALSLVSLEKAGQGIVQEGGVIRFLRDRETFYFSFKITDSDLVAESNENQVKQYEFGDTIELFLKPTASTSYFEYHFTPNQKNSSIFFLGRGRAGLPSNWNYRSKLCYRSAFAGTLNSGLDRDRSWSGEVAIPIAELEKMTGHPFGNATEWTLFVGRYNFSRYLKDLPENTVYPAVQAGHFHSLSEYSKIRFMKEPK